MKRVIAAAIIKDKKLLIAQRAKGEYLEGMWEFPGGKIETGETDEECIIREIKEELNIEISVESYLGEHRFKNEKSDINLVLYKAKGIGGEPTLSVHDRIEWVEVKELKNYLFAPADTYFVKTLIPNKIGLLGL